MIVRINHGFGSTGTIPGLKFYRASPKPAPHSSAGHRCGDLVIGNEPNHEVERPDGQTDPAEAIRECYYRCRTAIHHVPGHQGDQVLVAGPALWNATTRYAGNPSGDWISISHTSLRRSARVNATEWRCTPIPIDMTPGKIKADIPQSQPGLSPSPRRVPLVPRPDRSHPDPFSWPARLCRRDGPHGTPSRVGRRQEQWLGAHSLRGDRRVERKTHVASPSSRSCSIAGSRPPISRNGPSRIGPA